MSKTKTTAPQPSDPCPECGRISPDAQARREHANDHWGIGSGAFSPDELKGEARKRYLNLAKTEGPARPRAKRADDATDTPEGDDE